ncbi:MAG: hemerythrin family protein [Terracidiphilus sp.]
MTTVATHRSEVVGVQAMDDQHGILMDTLNALRQQLARGNGSARLNEQMARLIEFTDMHFGCEESLLRRYGFPGLEQHRAAHQRLMEQIRQAVSRADRGDDAELHRMLGFVRGQYVEHVEGPDREYGRWLNERGVY